LGLPTFPLFLELADARDHAQARLERVLGPHPHGLIGLAEVLPALRVADDRAPDAELEQDQRRDLAGEGTVVGPVDVLGVDRVAARDTRAERSERWAKHRIDAVGRRERCAELAGRAGSFEHLPVAGDQHRRVILEASEWSGRSRPTHWLSLPCGYWPAGQGLVRLPLLKFSKRVIGVFPGPGKICEIKCVNSVAELPPKSLTVPGMKSPPPCHEHAPPLARVEKNGKNAAPGGGGGHH